MKAFSNTGAAILLLTVMTVSLGQTPPAHKASLPAGSATVSEWKGDVVLHAAQGALVPCQRGLVLEAGAVIQTAKGSLLLTLQDQSQVLVEPNSQVVLEAPDQSGGKYLQQIIGKILAKVQKRIGVTPSFRMGTPTAVISVRGTEFAVSVNRRGRTSVEVFEGLVEVQGLGAFGAPVMVRPNFATEVNQDKAPEQPHESQDNRKGEDNAWPGLGGSSGKGNSEDSPSEQHQTPNQTTPNKGEGPED
jgi:hypothetical protein